MLKLSNKVRRWIAARSEPQTGEALIELLECEKYGADHLVTEVSAVYELWYEGDMPCPEMMRELRRVCTTFLRDNPPQQASDPPQPGDPPIPT